MRLWPSKMRTLKPTHTHTWTVFITPDATWQDDRVTISQLSLFFHCDDWEIWRRKGGRGWRESRERRGGNGTGRPRHRYTPFLFSLQGCKKLCHTANAAETPHRSPAHAMPTNSSPIASRCTHKQITRLAPCVWLRSRRCCLIYRSSLWVCACREFGYLLCHAAGEPAVSSALGDCASASRNTCPRHLLHPSPS